MPRNSVTASAHGTLTSNCRRQIAVRLAAEIFTGLKSRSLADGKTIQDKIEEYVVIGLLVDEECDERADRKPRPSHQKS